MLGKPKEIMDAERVNSLDRFPSYKTSCMLSYAQIILVSEMKYWVYVSSGMLNHTHSLTCAQIIACQVENSSTCWSNLSLPFDYLFHINLSSKHCYSAYYD